MSSTTIRQIKINGTAYPHPRDFSMESVPNIVSSIKTLSGRIISDVNGWVYADKTLIWDWIDSDTIEDLMDDTDPLDGTFTFTFDDMITGTQKTVNALRTKVGGNKIPTITPDGNVQWSNITMTITFPDCYTT